MSRLPRRKAAEAPQVGQGHVAVDLDGMGADGHRGFGDPRGVAEVRRQHGFRSRGEPRDDAARLRFADLVLGAVRKSDEEAERGGAAVESGVRVFPRPDAAHLHKGHL